MTPTPSFQSYSGKQDERAINWRYFLKVTVFGVGLAVAVSLIPFDKIWGIGPDENFDSYNIGALTGQDEWLGYGAGTSTSITTNQQQTGTKSVRSDPVMDISSNQLWITTSTDLWLRFYIYIDEPADYEKAYLYVCENDTYCCSLGINGDTAEVGIGGQASTVDTGIAAGEWHLFDLRFNADNRYCKGTIDNNVFGIIKTAADFDYVNKEVIYMTDWKDDNKVAYLDSISEIDCDPLTCTGCDYDACELVPEYCQWNQTTQQCERLNLRILCGPYWSCQWCQSTSTCANVGCTWVDNSCVWLETEYTTATDAYTYYQQHSDFATPSDMYWVLSSTTAPFFNLLNQWLTTYGQIFNRDEAEDYGSTTGSFIPKVRGYLGLLDPLLADFPLGDILTIVLTLGFVVIVIRVVRRLWTFIKAW